MATIEFVPLKDFENDYEILSQYPYTIRKKDNHYEVKECDRGAGYPSVRLNNKTYNKHILIAKQFLPNDDPEHKIQVDHIDKHRDNYHIENLRWVSPSGNCKNKTSHLGVIYEYVDDIPDEAIRLTDYSTRNGKNEFENYYYYDDIFYFYNGIKYRKLHINEKKWSGKFVHVRDTNNERVQIYYTNFKKQYDLI
ncbi:hypothetical protein M9Y10_024336 [Tritrichomonas musculus]|uniref:HNH nuclease domain-containing protein n=1 Tax=Tritrichomonas musculus TaxID=1915356 RepID=A0ABR2HDP8_9EUKA